MINAKYRRNLAALVFLSFASSCLFLGRSEIIKPDEEEVISVMTLKIIYDGKLQRRDRGPLSFCRIDFKNEDFETIKYRNNESYQFYIIKSRPEMVNISGIRCMHHVIPIAYLKHRFAKIDDLSFRPKSGFINYIGDITVSYDARGFRLHDLFALGGLFEDKSGAIRFKVEDKIDEAISFFYKNYPELQNIPFTKSLANDATKIKPNEKPEPYIPRPTQPRTTAFIPMQPPAIPMAAPPPIQAAPPPIPAVAPNPYYAPYYSPEPYYDPYQGKMVTP